jgi:hypothetical protein
MLRHGDVTWSNPKVLTTLALIFLCGAAIGSAITRGYIRSHLAMPARTPPAIEQARHVGLADLRQKLNLTPAQEKVITKILDDYGKFYQNIEDEREDVAAVGKERILEALTPEQRRLFNELIARPK